MDARASRSAGNSRCGGIDVIFDHLGGKSLHDSWQLLARGGMLVSCSLASHATPKAHCYVFDEPTWGIDVSARFALYELMVQIAERGGAILMISSDLPEVLGMSDRVYVMREGEISGHLTRDQATEQSVLSQMMPAKVPGPTAASAS